MPEGYYIGESDVVLGEDRLDGIVASGLLVPLAQTLPRRQGTRLATEVAPLLSRGSDVVPSGYRTGRCSSVVTRAHVRSRSTWSSLTQNRRSHPAFWAKLGSQARPRRFVHQIAELGRVVLGRARPSVAKRRCRSSWLSGRFCRCRAAFLQLDCQHMANTWLDELPIDSIHCFTDRVTREGLFKDLRRELLDLGQSIPVHYVTSLA